MAKSSNVFAGLGALRVGPRVVSKGTVFAIMQELAGPSRQASAVDLRDRMMSVTDWPKRVLANPSYKQFGSQLWCEGYVVGSRDDNNRYFEDI